MQISLRCIFVYYILHQGNFICGVCRTRYCQRPRLRHHMAQCHNVWDTVDEENLLWQVVLAPKGGNVPEEVGERTGICCLSYTFSPHSQLHGERNRATTFSKLLKIFKNA